MLPGVFSEASPISARSWRNHCSRLQPCSGATIPRPSTSAGFETQPIHTPCTAAPRGMASKEDGSACVCSCGKVGFRLEPSPRIEICTLGRSTIDLNNRTYIRGITKPLGLDRSTNASPLNMKRCDQGSLQSRYQNPIHINSMNLNRLSV